MTHGRAGRNEVAVIEQGGAYTLLAGGDVAGGFWSRLVGLIGRRSLGAGKGLLIYPCSSVHTWFMRMPIDVVYVSREHRVVGIDRRLKPWRIGTIHRGVRYVIEVAGGGAELVQPGDILHLIGWEPRSFWHKAARPFQSG